MDLGWKGGSRVDYGWKGGSRVDYGWKGKGGRGAYNPNSRFDGWMDFGWKWKGDRGLITLTPGSAVGWTSVGSGGSLNKDVVYVLVLRNTECLCVCVLDQAVNGVYVYMYACMGTLRLGSRRGMRVYVCVYGYTEIKQWAGYTCVCMRVWVH